MKKSPIPYSQSYNEVDYDPKDIPMHKLVHSIFFSKKRCTVEYLSQLSLTPDDVKAPVVYARAKDHKIVAVAYESKKRDVLYRLINGHKAKITVIRALSKTRLVSGDDSGQVVVWDLTQQSILRKYNAHKERVVSVCPLNEHEFATASLDKRVKYWDCHENDYVKLLVSQQPIQAMILLSRDNILICYRDDNQNDINQTHIKFRVRKLVDGHFIEIDTLGIDLPRAMFSKSELLTQLVIQPNSEILFLTIKDRNCIIRKSNSKNRHGSFGLADVFTILPSGRVISHDLKELKPTLRVYEHPYEVKNILKNVGL